MWPIYARSNSTRWQIHTRAGLEVVDAKVLVAENSSPGSVCKGKQTKPGQTLAHDTVHAGLLAVHPDCRQAAAAPLVDVCLI